MKIVLIGYMASGKSTIGRLLAAKMDFSFIDLDDYIEKKEKMTITEIFENKGEIYFRKVEHLYLKEVLTLHKNIVLSLGGGTPCYAGNMNSITKSKNTISIYLKTSVTTIVNRLTNEKDQRPLVARLKEDELAEFVAKHLFERNHYYNKATHTLAVDNKNIEEIVKESYQLLS